MRRPFPTLALLALSIAPGCAGNGDARYVYQDGQYGVIGIPKNSNRWPHRYCDQADTLMKDHFPEGYQVVRAEEVVEGKRELDNSSKRSGEYKPSLLLPAALANLGSIKREGESKQHDQVTIRESRLIYKSTAPAGRPAGNYAAVASLAPDQYVDPNAAERRQAQIAVAESKASADVALQKAAFAPTPGGGQ